MVRLSESALGIGRFRGVEWNDKGFGMVRVRMRRRELKAAMKHQGEKWEWALVSVANLCAHYSA